jgi:penicillin-binding protein 1B
LGLEDNGLKILTDNLEKIKMLRQQVVYPSILLGATLMTPFEVAQMYQVIANSGYFTPLTTIRQVMDSKHKVLTRIPLYSAEVFKRRNMIQVQRAMIGVTEEGTARYLHTRFPDKTFAGKTGTTNDLRDSWFAGFSDRYLTVVWLGDDDNLPINLTGSSGALRVWADIMQQTDDNPLKLGVDTELEWQYVDRLTGGKTEKFCEDAVLLPFVKGSKPSFTTTCKSNILERGFNWLQQQLH